MRAWVAVIFALVLVPVLAHADPGDRVPLTQDQLWVPGPNGDQAFMNSLRDIGAVLEAIPQIYPGYIQNFQATPGGQGHPARATFKVKVPWVFRWVFRDNRGDITLSVDKISCSEGTGYRLDFDLSRSSRQVSKRFDELQMDLCDLQKRADGVYLMNASTYAVEGPDASGPISSEILQYMKTETAPMIEDAVENHFQSAANAVH